TKLRHWVPILLFFVLVVYLIVGSACFWFFEHHRHEQNVRKWYMNLAVNRRHFARSISSRIFNDTRNLLIIIDREQTERVQNRDSLAVGGQIDMVRASLSGRSFAGVVY
ncbi:hypothetical protein OSTOST_21223, partial [Ostertagia ostertagi]